MSSVMALEWGAYQDRLTKHGPTERERRIEETRRVLSKQAALSPACREVLVDRVPQKLFINRNEVLNKKNFNTLPGEVVRLGSVIYWENCHWLVTESVRDDEMTYRGIFQQCNRQLVWQNPETREIIRRWCTIEKPYYSNLQSGIQFAFSTREFKVQLPYDDESCLLDVDKKFMLDVIDKEPKVYACTSIDMNTERYDVNGEAIGFIVMNLTQRQYNPDTDSLEYGICDYLEPYDFLRPTEEGYLVLELSEEGVVPGGHPVILTAAYFNYSDGTPRSGDRTVYTFSCSQEVRRLLKTRDTNAGLEISLGYSPTVIGETIKIQAVNKEGTIGNTIELEVVNAF